MQPNRIIFIRHAEKPGYTPGYPDAKGLDVNGSPDDESLTTVGWQRAGALARFFNPAGVGAYDDRPNVIYASKIEPGSKSQRPQQTITPLFNLLKAEGVAATINFDHPKSDIEGVAKDILGERGVVLVAWEHQLIHAIIEQIAPGSGAPTDWPQDRYDVVLTLDPKEDGGWTLTQRAQLLLAGDSPKPI